MLGGSRFGQDMVGLLLFASGGFRAGFESEAIIASFENMASVGKPIEQRRGHLRITKDRRPFAEAEIGGDDDAGALVELAQQMEEQRAA